MIKLTVDTAAQTHLMLKLSGLTPLLYGLKEIAVRSRSGQCQYKEIILYPVN